MHYNEVALGTAMVLIQSEWKEKSTEVNKTVGISMSGLDL